MQNQVSSQQFMELNKWRQLSKPESVRNLNNFNQFRLLALQLLLSENQSPLPD